MKVLTSNKTSNRPFTTIISLQLKQNKTNSSTPKRKNVIKSKTNNKLAFWNYQSMFLVYLIFFWTHKTSFSSVQSLSCVRLFPTMNCSTPGLPVHHQLLEFTQTHIHRVGDVIQPFHPLLSPSQSYPQSLPASESFPMSQLFA